MACLLLHKLLTVNFKLFYGLLSKVTRQNNIHFFSENNEELELKCVKLAEELATRSSDVSDRRGRKRKRTEKSETGTGKPVFLRSSPVVSHRPAKRKPMMKSRKINQLRKNHLRLRKRREKLQTN